jgi:hypothetical protein
VAMSFCQLGRATRGAKSALGSPCVRACWRTRRVSGTSCVRQSGRQLVASGDSPLATVSASPFRCTPRRSGRRMVMHLVRVRRARRADPHVRPRVADSRADGKRDGALLRSGCSSDTSPPAGCCRAAPEVRGQPVSAEQVRRSGCAGDAREAHGQPVQRVALPGDAVGRRAAQDEETSMVKLDKRASPSNSRLRNRRLSPASRGANPSLRGPAMSCLPWRPRPSRS